MNRPVRRMHSNAQPSKKFANVLYQELGLFCRCKVASVRHFRPALDVIPSRGGSGANCSWASGRVALRGTADE